MRTTMIVLATSVALIIPNFTVFVNLLGSVRGSILAFMLPPLMYNKEFAETISISSKVFNYVIVVIGIATCIFSIVTNVQDIIDGNY